MTHINCFINSYIKCKLTKHSNQKAEIGIIKKCSNHMLPRDSLDIQRYHNLKVKWWKKISHANSDQKRVGIDGKQNRLQDKDL